MPGTLIIPRPLLFLLGNKDTMVGIACNLIEEQNYECQSPQGYCFHHGDYDSIIQTYHAQFMDDM